MTKPWMWRGLPGVEPGQHGNRCQPKGWLCGVLQRHQ